MTLFDGSYVQVLTVSSEHSVTTAVHLRLVSYVKDGKSIPLIGKLFQGGEGGLLF